MLQEHFTPLSKYKKFCYKQGDEMDMTLHDELKQEIEEKKQEKVILVGNITQLSSEKISLLDEITSINKDVVEKRKLSEKSKKSHSDIERETHVLTSEIRRLQAEIHNAKSNLDSINIKVLEERAKVDTIVKDAQKDAENNKRKSVDLSTLKKELQENLAKTDIKFNEFQTKSVEVGEQIRIFGNKNKSLDAMTEKAEEEKVKSVVLQGELSKKVSETKMLKITLDERLIHIDEIKKVNEAKTNTLEEEKIDLQEREKEFEVKIKSYDSLRNNLDTEEKKLKIKQLRIDEIVRTKDIEKELKLLEKKANK